MLSPRKDEDVRKNNENENYTQRNVAIAVKDIEQDLHRLKRAHNYGKGPHIKSTRPMVRMPTRPERSIVSISEVIG